MTVSRVAVEEAGWTVARAAAAVRLVAPDRLEVAGMVVPLTPVAGVGAHELLQTTLYLHIYCHPIGTSFDTAWRPDEDRDIGDLLLAASRTHERWDGGWIVESVDAGGGALLRRDGDRRWAAPHSYRATGVTANGQTAAAELHIVPASRVEQPGFVHIFGETLPDGDEGAALARVYWNIAADAAPELVTRVSVALNRFRVPFRLKCLDRHAAYDRCDAAVLYLKRRHWSWAMALLGDSYRALAPALGPAVPLFTRRLAPGIGGAMDPETRESFGMHRCGIFARGLIDAANRGATTAASRTDIMLARFRAERIDPDRPYLNPGARDLFALPVDWPDA